MTDLPSIKIFSVSELTRSIRGLLETGFPFVTVAGEISNLRQPYSGHLYFTLKDEACQLKAVLFKLQQRYLSKPPSEGSHVVCRGRISVYEQRGDYQLIVDYMELTGDGALQVAFEQLKRRLAAEGLFAEQCKKKIPLLPSRLSLITSPTGAAVHDFLKVARSRFPSIPIEIMPVRVQGKEAVADIIEALNLLNRRKNSDLIILCRGGGSIEDLSAFNDELLARAIRASEIPVVSAIGHEVDFTIADFAADLRAPTPSAAAEIVIPDRSALLEKTITLQEKLCRELRIMIREYRRRIMSQKILLGDPRTLLAGFMLRVDHLQTSLVFSNSSGLNQRTFHLNHLVTRLYRQNPVHRLSLQKHVFSELSRQMRMLIRSVLDKKRRDLAEKLAVMEAVSPQAVLSRGYAIVRSRRSGDVVRASSQTTRGEILDVLLNRGRIECEVTRTQD